MLSFSHRSGPLSAADFARAQELLNKYFGPGLGDDLEVADTEGSRTLGAALMFRGYYGGVMTNIQGRPFINLALDYDGRIVHLRSRKDLSGFLMSNAATTAPRSFKWQRLDAVTGKLSETMHSIEWLARAAFGRGPKLVGDKVLWRDRYWKVVDGCLYATNDLESKGWYRFRGWK